jgi:hypothetical protein
MHALDKEIAFKPLKNGSAVTITNAFLQPAQCFTGLFGCTLIF